MVKKSTTGTYVITSDELDISTINGKEARSTCPLCREHRGNPRDHSLKIDITTGAGYCHHCHEKVLVTDYAEKFRNIPCRESKVREKCITEGITLLDDECRDYLENRSIDPKVATGAGVGSKVMHDVHYLAFPFMENGNPVNVQYKRADLQNKEFLFATGGKIIPWNADCLTEGDGTSPLYITEGMMDALALIQSGYPLVVSVPNGAGSRMEVFDDYRQTIKKNFSHIVFAGDNDAVGEELRDRVKKYFSDTDVSVVKWNRADCNCKDANEMLKRGGTDGVAFCIENAEYEGCSYFDVMECDDDEMFKVYEDGFPEGKGIGLNNVDKLVKYLPGYVYLVTGYPGSGKSSFVNYITMRLLKMYGWRSLFFSPEKMPKRNHRVELVSIVTGKKYDKTKMCRDELQLALNYLSGNVLQMKDDIRRDLNVILHAAEVAIRRYGIKVLVIDPFLYVIIKNLNGLSEATMISQMLCAIRVFAQQHNIVVILVAHPRKPNNNAVKPSKFELLYEVAGSSAFFDFCDVGFVLKREDEKSNMLSVTCGKARFSYLGSVGDGHLMYNPENGRYADCTLSGKVLETDVSNWTCKRNFFNRDKMDSFVCEKPF